MNFNDRFFILSLNEMQEFNKLPLAEKTLENYNRLCWEIKDVNIIKAIVEDKNIGNEKGEINTIRYGNKDWKKMFVFGAGASANCLKDSLEKPPLGNEIFS